MRNLAAFLVLVLVDGPILVFVDARQHPRFPPISTPLSSPYGFSASQSLEAFSPVAEIESAKHHMGSNKKTVISLIVASAALGLIILFFVCLRIYRKRNMLKSEKDDSRSSAYAKEFVLAPFMGKQSSSKMSSTIGAVTFMDYKLLETATNNFRESDILGVGGFGCVYKGLLDNNVYAAVKRLNGESPDSIREFQTEVDLLSKIRHPNIISLLGYSIHDDTRLIVYELMENGSLETQLHGPSHGSALTWYCRIKIALDTARGLEYLHEHCKPQVIHRDLKSSNILLDSNYNSKLSDFGLAVTQGTNKGNLKLSGTLGYVAPEYLLDGKLTDKSDVYAFGVVLLELLLGRRPVEKLAPSQCQSIVTWAMPQLTDRSKLPHIVDPLIRDTMDLKHLYQVAAVAVLCIQPEPSYRPLITDVLHSLVPLVPVELGGTLRIAQNKPALSVLPTES
ncbi:Protein kinase domain-containing protein [Heracleum sosnowskyi]|uniref:Protein kinase domain-containing protein n=1 Tax=Heracleum sosnowskyi TaxID=360622 RepID=A0AAD8HME7_9APIA|nr:Protein kinase domain-containing protein [Heracleum sosnowskyi]